MKLLLLALLLLASCTVPTEPVAWTGCYAIYIGNSATTGSIGRTATTLRVAEFVFDSVSENGNSITGTRTLTAGSVTSVSRIELTRTVRGVGGVLIRHTWGSDCDSRDTQLVWCEPVPCENNNNNNN